jgi:predicted MFS family arabinose efflux permease
MPPILNVIALATFAAALSSRALDPVVPLVSADLTVSIATAASLSTAMALTFAIVQPIIGAAADMFGKARLLIVCLAMLAAANIAGALATSFEMLFLSRIFCGIAAGGTFPVAMGLAADLFSLEKRQVALGRVLSGVMTGNLLGASAAGVIGDFLGWRGVLAVLGALMVLMSFLVWLGFRRGGVNPARQAVNLGALRRGYVTIINNPNARICYTSVFLNGLLVFGFFPFVAALLFESGETRASIPGLIIAIFAIGGLIYSVTVSRMLAVFSVKGLMITGALVVAVQFVAVGLGPDWRVQAICFLLMGIGFYSFHGSLQVFSSDLAPDARASAMSLHAFFFFLGQAAGPLVYGFALAHVGTPVTLSISGAVMLASGTLSARLLHRKPVAQG